MGWLKKKKIIKVNLPTWIGVPLWTQIKEKGICHGGQTAKI